MLGGSLNAYHLSGGRIIVCGVQKDVAAYKDQILMFYQDDAKDLGDCLMVAFTSSPSHVLFFQIWFFRNGVRIQLVLVVGLVTHLKSPLCKWNFGTLVTLLRIPSRKNYNGGVWAFQGSFEDRGLCLYLYQMDFLATSFHQMHLFLFFIHRANFALNFE